jgi:HTH-like domain
LRFALIPSWWTAYRRRCPAGAVYGRRRRAAPPGGRPPPRKENAELKRTNEILRVGERVFRPGGRPDPAHVVTFVEAHPHTFGVAPLLAAIGEPVSTFYNRVSRVPSTRAVADVAVAERIEEIWQRSRRSYGAPHIYAMLAREGIRVGPQTGGATCCCKRRR